MGTIARGMRVLHTRGMDLMEKAEQTDRLVDFEGAPTPRLDPDYIIARLEQWKNGHPREELTVETRIGLRIWGKLRHMRVVTRILRLPPITEYRAEHEEQRAKEKQVTRYDPVLRAYQAIHRL